MTKQTLLLIALVIVTTLGCRTNGSSAYIKEGAITKVGIGNKVTAVINLVPIGASAPQVTISQYGYQDSNFDLDESGKPDSLWPSELEFVEVQIGNNLYTTNLQKSQAQHAGKNLAIVKVDMSSLQGAVIGEVHGWELVGGTTTVPRFFEITKTLVGGTQVWTKYGVTHWQNGAKKFLGEYKERS